MDIFTQKSSTLPFSAKGQTQSLTHARRVLFTTGLFPIPNEFLYHNCMYTFVLCTSFSEKVYKARRQLLVKSLHLPDCLLHQMVSVGL